MKVGQKIYYLEPYYKPSICDGCDNIVCGLCKKEESEEALKWKVKSAKVKSILELFIIAADRFVSKKDCFTTFAEAQAECDRRNNG